MRSPTTDSACPRTAAGSARSSRSTAGGRPGVHARTSLPGRRARAPRRRRRSSRGPRRRRRCPRARRSGACSLAAVASSTRTRVFGRWVTSADSISTPASSSAARTAARSAGSVTTSNTSSSSAMSSAPASIATIRSSSSSASAVDDDHALLVEEVGHRARLAEVAAVLGEQVADVGAGAVAVVGHRLDEHRDAAGAVALVQRPSRARRRRRPRPCPWRSRARCCPWASRRPWPSGSASAERRVALGVAAALLGGDRDRARELGEELAAARVDDRLLVLDPRPLRMPGHGSRASGAPGGRARRIGCGAMPRPASEIFKAYDIRGLYGEQIDGDVAEQIGRAFARVLADLAGKPAGELRIGLGRDMRLTAPELAARYRDGMVAEGAHVLDAGQVGTEMLYFLVGSRELDGGLMCTASHNPKAYTGAKLVRAGRDRAVRRRGHPGHPPARSRTGLGRPAPGGGSVEEVDIYDGVPGGGAARSIDPANVRPLKVVVDGGNGMAGPMVGPLLERLRLELVETYWTPDGDFPDHEPNPLLPENRQFIIDKVLAEGADLGIAWDGDADRCFFIDDTGRFVDGDFLTAILAEHLLAKRGRRADRSSTTCAPRAPSPTPSRARRRPRVHQPRRPRVLQDADARRGRDLRRRGLRPLLLPRLLQRRLRHDPGAADPREALARGQDDERAARALPRRSTSSRARSTPRSPTRTAKMARDRGALRPTARDQPPRRRLGRLRRLALQRAPVEHRAAAAPVPGVARLATRTWSAGATRCSGSSAPRDPPPAHPDAVRGRARQRATWSRTTR